MIDLIASAAQVVGRERLNHWNQEGIASMGHKTPLNKRAGKNAAKPAKAVAKGAAKPAKAAGKNAAKPAKPVAKSGAKPAPKAGAKPGAKPAPKAASARGAANKVRGAANKVRGATNKAKEALKKATKVASGITKPRTRIRERKIYTHTKFTRPDIKHQPRNPKYPRRSVPRTNKMTQYRILKAPLTTESAMKRIEDHNTLVFTVDLKSSKWQIKDAVKKMYDIKPFAVRTSITMTGEKKAYVKLRKDTDALDVANKIGII